MNIDELKSTPAEREQLHKQFEETVSDSYTDGAMRLGQLKLLEWLNGYCDNDDHPGYYSESQRCECGECMYELETELKEW